MLHKSTKSKNIALNFSGKTVSFSLPAGKGSFFILVDRCLYVFGGVVYVLAWPILTLLMLSEPNPSSTILVSMLVIEILLAGILLLSLVTRGWEILIDPPLILPVLLFVFLTTLAYLLAAVDGGELQIDLFSTFGTNDAKSLGAIAVAAFAGWFYLGLVFIRGVFRVNWWWRTILITAALWLLFTAFGITNVPASQVKEVALLAQFAVIIFGSLFVWGGYSSSKSLWVLVGLLVALGVSFSFTQEPLSKLFTPFVLIASALILRGKKAFRPKSTIATLWYAGKNWTQGKSHAGSILVAQPIVSMLLLAIVLLVITFAWGGARGVDWAAELNEFGRQYANYFGNVTSWTGLLFGQGAKVNYYSVTAVDVLHYQGLLGGVAYMVICGSALWYALRVRASRYSQVLFPVILAPVIWAITTEMTFGVSMWWWGLVAFMVAQELKVPTLHLPGWLSSEKPLAKWFLLLGAFLVILGLVGTFINGIISLYSAGTI